MGKRARSPEPQEKREQRLQPWEMSPSRFFSGVVSLFSPVVEVPAPLFPDHPSLALGSKFSLGIIPDFSTGLHSWPVPKPNFPSWRSPDSSFHALTIQALPAQLSLGIIPDFSTGLSQSPHPFHPRDPEIPLCSPPDHLFLGIIPVFCIPSPFPILSIPGMSLSHFSCSAPTQTQLSLGIIPVFCSCSAPSPNFPIPGIPTLIFPCSAPQAFPVFPWDSAPCPSPPQDLPLLRLRSRWELGTNPCFDYPCSEIIPNQRNSIRTITPKSD